jgi:hypothetical protein
MGLHRIERNQYNNKCTYCVRCCISEILLFFLAVGNSPRYENEVVVYARILDVLFLLRFGRIC